MSGSPPRRRVTPPNSCRLTVGKLLGKAAASRLLLLLVLLIVLLLVLLLLLQRLQVLRSDCERRPIQLARTLWAGVLNSWITPLNCGLFDRDRARRPKTTQWDPTPYWVRHMRDPTPY